MEKAFKHGIPRQFDSIHDKRNGSFDIAKARDFNGYRFGKLRWRNQTLGTKHVAERNVTYSKSPRLFFLGPLLGLAGTSHPHTDEGEARRFVLQAALGYLRQHRESGTPEWTSLYDDLERHYHHRLATLDSESDLGSEIGGEHYARYLSLSRELLKVERQATLKLLQEGRIDDELARELEHEFDLSEIRVEAALRH